MYGDGFTHQIIMQIKAHAKINLALDILGKDKITDYHFIQTVITQVPTLFDTIEIREIQADKISIDCSNKDLEADETNTCYKAAKLLKEKFKINKGVEIKIDKKIPLSSGLGGGSSDAAAVLKALSEIWHLNLKTPELEEIATKIGMDTVFFLYGGTCVCSHFGDNIYQLPELKNIEIQIIDTGVKIASAEAYKQIDYKKIGQQKQLTDQLISLLKSQKIEGLEKLIHNDFELSVNKNHPQITAAIEELKSKGAASAHLSGSGGCVFGLF